MDVTTFEVKHSVSYPDDASSSSVRPSLSRTSSTTPTSSSAAAAAAPSSTSAANRISSRPLSSSLISSIRATLPTSSSSMSTSMAPSSSSSTSVSSSSSSSMIREVNALHADKVRILLKSNDAMKRKIEEMKAEGRDNNRVKMIKALKLQVRELETVCETLKSGIMSRGAAVSDIDDMLETALNAPRRVRPPRPETLKREIAQLRADNHQLSRRVAAAAPVPHVAQLKRQPISSSSVPSVSSSSGGRRRASIGGSGRTDATSSNNVVMSTAVTISQQLEIARCDIDAQKNIISAHQQMLVETQAQLRLLRGGESKSKRLEEDNAELTIEIKRLKEKLLMSVSNDEQLYQEVRLLRGQLVAAEMAKSKTESKRDAHSSKAERDLLRYRERESQLLAQLAMLRTDVQAARDVADWHKSRAEKARGALDPSSIMMESTTINELRDQLAESDAKLEQRNKEMEVLLMQPNDAPSSTNMDAESALKEARDATAELHAGLEIAQSSLSEKDNLIADLQRQIATNRDDDTTTIRQLRDTINDRDQQLLSVKDEHTRTVSEQNILHLAAIGDLKRQIEVLQTAAAAAASSSNSNNNNNNSSSSGSSSGSGITDVELLSLRRDADQSVYNAALAKRLKAFITLLQAHIEIVESVASTHGAIIPARPTLDNL